MNNYSKNKAKIIRLFVTMAVILGIAGLVVFCFVLNKNSKNGEHLLSISGLSSQEVSFLMNSGFLPPDQEEKGELKITDLKSPALKEQNLNSSEESFEVLATKLDSNNYQLVFKLENKSEQSKEFYLIPISKESQLQFEEIKGVIGNKNTLSIGKEDVAKEPLEQLYDVEKHKKELNPELARAYGDIKNNNYQPSPIKITLNPKSTLLAKSQWQIVGDRASAKLEPVYFLVYGSAGGAKEIFISKAFKLDQDKNIIADIYDVVKKQDGNWALLTNGQYVRVTFGQILDRTKDNTVYARPTDPSFPAQIEVYPVYIDQEGNTTEGPLVAVFPSIDHEGTFKALLTNLQTPTDIFDLKVSGDIEINYIVDPTGVILNSATGKSCNTLCTENGYDSCISIGTDAGGTDGGIWTGFDGDCYPSSGDCTFSFWPSYSICSGHWTDWTNCLCSSAGGATYYWVGGTTNSNTSNPANWSTTAGACANSANTNVPTSADDVHFVSNCTNSATINSALSVKEFYMDAGYTGTVTQNATLTAAGSVTLAAGTLDASASGCSGVSCTISVIGNWVNTGGTFTARTGTVTLTGTSAEGAITSRGSSFYNLTQSGASGTYTLQDALTVSNALTIAATLACATKNLTVSTTLSNSGLITTSTGVISIPNAASGDFTFTDTNNIPAATYNDLSINASGKTVTLAGDITAYSIYIYSGSTLDTSSSHSYAIILSGESWQDYGTFVANQNTVTFSGSIQQHITTHGDSFNNVTISNNSIRLESDVVIGGNLVISEGKTPTIAGWSFDFTVAGTTDGTAGGSAETLTVSSYTITPAPAWGDITFTGAVGSGDSTKLTTLTIASSAALLFSGAVNITGAFDQTSTATGTTTFSSTLAAGSATFRGTTINLGGATTISGNLNIAVGTLDVTAGNSALNVGGNWVNSVGGSGFTARSGTVTLNGTTQTVSGTTTFNNLTISKTNSPTISFTSGTTFTIGGAFTATGDATHQITIGATTTSAATLSKASGTVSCSYCTISYSTATGGATWEALTAGNINGGYNSGWLFSSDSTAAAIKGNMKVKGGWIIKF